jgi:outer membrane protein
MNTSFSRIGKQSALCALTLVSASAMAQTYTFKVGGARIDPRATSSDIQGTLPTGVGALPVYPVPAGNQLEVQTKSTLVFSIARSFDDNWEAELVLGVPPEHDVKLRVGDGVKATAAIPNGVVATLPLQSQVGVGVARHVAAYDGVVVAKVKQTAPTLFLNYKFLSPSSALRPYVGVGVNYTNFKVTSTQAGNELYNDGAVRISSTDSIGLAFQMGANYKFDKNWLVSASWATAGAKNNVTIRTNVSEQTLSYRFHPSVFSLMVGYAY